MKSISHWVEQAKAGVPFQDLITQIIEDATSEKIGNSLDSLGRHINQYSNAQRSHMLPTVIELALELRDQLLEMRSLYAQAGGDPGRDGSDAILDHVEDVAREILQTN